MEPSIAKQFQQFTQLATLLRNLSDGDYPCLEYSTEDSSSVDLRIRMVNTPGGRQFCLKQVYSSIGTEGSGFYSNDIDEIRFYADWLICKRQRDVPSVIKKLNLPVKLMTWKAGK